MTDAPMSERGSYNFATDKSGSLLASEDNLDRTRRLFRDSDIIAGNWGPGDAGDFDHGSWHILCHLAGGAGLFRLQNGLAWAAITHVPATDSYAATLSVASSAQPLPLLGQEARALLQGAQLIAYVEGSSLGHVMARAARDNAAAFNGWKRQDFDRGIDDPSDGGTVWEHWCTTRDIRLSNAMGSAVLRAYLELVSVLGGRFVSVVARGRREHEHPRHLVALVKAGFLSREEAVWDITPLGIPAAAQQLLYEARPAEWLAAANLLAPLATQLSYLMFERRIGRFSSARSVTADLQGI